METLKVLVELQIASSILNSPFLVNLFKKFSPQHSTELKQILKDFHFVDEGDGLDFKAAHHQLSDWIFGWNVSELNTDTNNNLLDVNANVNDSNFNHDHSAPFSNSFSSSSSSSTTRDGSLSATSFNSKTTNPTDAPNDPALQTILALHRVPRNFNIQDPQEKAECMRLIETFQTQFSMAFRRLQRNCFAAESHFSMLGKGIKHLFPNEHLTNLMQQETDKVLWEIGFTPFSDSLNGEKPPFHSEETAAYQGTHETPSFSITNPLEQEEHTLEIESEPNAPSSDPLPGALPTSAKSSLNPKPGKRASFVNLSSSFSAKESNSGARPGRKSFTKTISSLKVPLENEVPIEEKKKDPTSISSSSEANSEAHSSPTAHANSNVKPNAAKEKLNKDSTTPSASSSTSFSEVDSDTIPLTGEELIKQDLDFVFYDLSIIMDLFVSCLICCIVILSFSELVREKSLFVKYLSQVHVLSHLFIQTPFKLLSQAIQLSLPPAPPSIWSHVPFHELELVHQHLQRVLQTRQYQSGTHPFFIALNTLSAKFSLTNHLFVGFDVYLFPTLIAAHKNGVKGLHAASFDENMWMTSGYDGKIRIFDFQTKTCVAQYSGHRSIVPDIHFVKNDTFILSCSFDKTLKIWNAQNATCEKTFTGHKDSITSCDISPDGKYIVSSSLDLTIRLWEFFTGECVATVKKHTKYVKQVRFSYDGRYVLSAGLDRRIYVWDIKILAYSKNITHYRCIEAHDDAILAMDLCRPGLLVSVSRDQSIKLWTFLNGQCLYTLSLAPSWACCVSFTSNGDLFAAGCFDNSVHLFDTKLGTRLRVLKIFNLGVLSLKFAKSNRFLVVGTTDGFIQKIEL